MRRALRWLARVLHIGSLERGDLSEDARRPVGNVDSLSAGEYDFPPNYVPPADEGRPRR